jgi:hypothetical protein
MEKMEGEKEGWIIGELISKLEEDVLQTSQRNIVLCVRIPQIGYELFA